VHGARSCWGADHTSERSSLLDPYGPGWNLKRDALDRDFAKLASRRGVECRVGQMAAVRRERQGWRILTAGGAPACEFVARFVIDASGRSGAFCRSQGGAGIAFDSTVALTATLDESQPICDSFTSICAVECGWWYFIRLPTGRQLVTLVTDLSEVPRGAASRREMFVKQLAMVRSEQMASSAGPIRLTPAWPQHRPVCGGEGWLAVGDAAATLDPLSSSGIARALESGRDGAEAAMRRLAGDRKAVNAFVQKTSVEYSKHLLKRCAYYRMERRFSQHAFWQQRSTQ
jgi:flavin-dependent dehydrogenase